MKTKQKNQNNKKIVFTGSVIVLIVSLFMTISYFRENTPITNKINSPQGISDSNVVKNSPPSADEQKSGDNIKPKISQNNNSQPQTESNIKPIITDAGYYANNIEVSSFIPGIYEDGGICTLTLSKDGQKITMSEEAIKDAKTLRCQNFIVAKSELSSGEWSVLISYKSAKHFGVSVASKVLVP